MRITIKFDYNTYLVCPVGQDVGPLLQALSGGIMCREEGYGKDRKFIPKDDGETAFEVLILPDDSVSLPDSKGENPWVAALSKARQELTDEQAKRWEKDQKIKGTGRKAGEVQAGLTGG